MKFPTRQKAANKRRRTNRSQPLSTDLMLKLYELLQGERDMVRVHSDALDSDICFVNAALCDPSSLLTDCPVYTTRELVHVLSLSADEFRRFHEVKAHSHS